MPEVGFDVDRQYQTLVSTHARDVATDDDVLCELEQLAPQVKSVGAVRSERNTHFTAHTEALATVFVAFNYRAAAVVVFQPSVADEIAHHREIAVWIARGYARAIGTGLVLIDAVVGMRKHHQRDRPALPDQAAQAARRLCTRGFGVVLAKYP